MHEITTDCGSRFYTSKPFPLPFCSFRTFSELRRAYGSGEGHRYFDPSTLAFFGSEGFSMIAGTNGAGTVERQANAPANMRYRAELWAFDDDGRPDPFIGCSHATLRDAKACAVATFAALAGMVPAVTA